MAQQTVLENKLWVLVSMLKEHTNDQDLERIAPKISDLVDHWHTKGKFIWSGPFDDNKTGMAVFEATEQEAHEFFEQNKEICDEVLDTYIHHWEALPFLSVL